MSGAEIKVLEVHISLTALKSTFPFPQCLLLSSYSTEAVIVLSYNSP